MDTPEKYSPSKGRRHVDTLRANDEDPNTKSQTLFFGIPKGTFYKKSPLAGYGAAPHEASLIAAFSRRPDFAGKLASAVQARSEKPYGLIKPPVAWAAKLIR